ncbi:pistil-specific extensin-like protein [Leptopilina heterotoma]|uniref:pistil-specific extensin-like protein n=1 Tax=Leptopilina heterotoma TaxID=63436 RepID=UPI001CA9426E|nr:pistil-specific extensin-like protein [Leptopilina heterotoma]XP_043480346.1 pistil-specific extensin-like protein [Leptopilina heterotoma]
MPKRRPSNFNTTEKRKARNLRQSEKLKAKLANWALLGTLRKAVGKPSPDGNNNELTVSPVIPRTDSKRDSLVGPTIRTVEILPPEARILVRAPISPPVFLSAPTWSAPSDQVLPENPGYQSSGQSWEPYYPTRTLTGGQQDTYVPTPRRQIRVAQEISSIEEEIAELTRLLEATPYEAPSPLLILTPEKKPPTIDLVTPQNPSCVSAPLWTPSKVPTPPPLLSPIRSPRPPFRSISNLEEDLALSDSDQDILELSPGSPISRSPRRHSPLANLGPTLACRRQLWSQPQNSIPSLLDMPIICPEDLQLGEKPLVVPQPRIQEQKPYTRPAAQAVPKSRSRGKPRTNQDRLKGIFQRFKPRRC